MQEWWSHKLVRLALYVLVVNLALLSFALTLKVLLPVAAAALQILLPTAALILILAYAVKRMFR